MKLFLDWSGYQNAGMGDAYADIPKNGGDFAKAVAVCIGSRQRFFLCRQQINNGGFGIAEILYVAVATQQELL